MSSARELETFFKEARVPVHLAAAAYSGDEEFRRLQFIDHGNQVERNSVSKLLKPFITPPDRWNGIAVHVAVIPVELGERMCWDLALVYRGTQPFSVRNWITDFTFQLEPVEDDILRHPDGRQQSSLLVHRGFHQAFKNLHQDPQQSSESQQSLTIQQGCRMINRINSAVRDVKEEIIRNLELQTTTQQLQSRSITQQLHSRLANSLHQSSPRRVLCIGHSLGGALATLSAAWCKTTLCQGVPEFRNSPVHCITVGSPRVGNEAFATAWTRLVLGDAAAADSAPSASSLSYRIVNALDPVPSLPPNLKLFGDSFQHVGTLVYLERRVDNWSTNIVAQLCKERPWGNCMSVLDHFQWKYTAALDAAEVHMSSGEGGGSGGNCYCKQLKLAVNDLWKEFWGTLQALADISIKDHIKIMLFCWGLGAVLGAVLAILSATLFGMMVFVYFVLLPVVTLAFPVDVVIRALPTKVTGLQIVGFLFLPIPLVFVMLLTKGAVWFGL